MSNETWVIDCANVANTSALTLGTLLVRHPDGNHSAFTPKESENLLDVVRQIIEEYPDTSWELSERLKEKFPEMATQMQRVIRGPNVGIVCGGPA